MPKVLRKEAQRRRYDFIVGQLQQLKLACAFWGESRFAATPQVGKLSGMCISRGIGQAGAARSARYLHQLRTMRSAKVRFRIPIAVCVHIPWPLRPCLAQRPQGVCGPNLRQASAMPPREGGARGATGPNGCTDPWGHAANGPAPAPCGRVLGSLLPLGHLGRADVIDSVPEDVHCSWRYFTCRVVTHQVQISNSVAIISTVRYKSS